MDLFSTDFLLALGAIIVIDLLLAGDNAIVIALAARKLPADLQRRAILWGTVGAIAVRTAMTLVVVWLLRLPGLMLVGGVMLVWIAYQLLAPEKEHDASAAVNPASGFWGALRTIVVADMVMGLDNVLAVAGAAHGSFLLVTLGLLISVPIMVFGSTMLLRYVERYPVLIYFGAGVLAWTAGKMIVGEPLLASFFQAHGPAPIVMPLLVLAVVLAAGFIRNQRQLDFRNLPRFSRLAETLDARAQTRFNSEGELSMPKILVPVDGSPNAEQAVRHVIREQMGTPSMEVHLLNVQTPLTRAVAQFLSRKSREDWHRDQATQALRASRELLDLAGIRYAVHIELGRKADTIVALAKRLACDHIVMGTARKNSLTRLLEASVTNRVLELTTVPVEVIAGTGISRFERYGIPAGLGGALTLLLFAVAD